MDGGAQHNPLTVEEVFMDFKGRRVGILKALTTDVEYLYQECKPERKKRWLYAFASEQWEVGYYPSNEKFPEPILDIKLGGRDGMREKEWLTDVAARSDACLLSLAFYFAGRFGFDQADRERLFSMINGLPTIYQVVAESRAEKQVKEKPVLVINHNTNQSNSKKAKY